MEKLEKKKRFFLGLHGKFNFNALLAFFFMVNGFIYVEPIGLICLL